ncbi:MAG: sugar phosphate isomerase/epimerase [Abitibacteriaceae bacterium]|nr:sugar phosphate isomerase/epimerase [Abditibacteriaceae bacterium]
MQTKIKRNGLMIGAALTLLSTFSARAAVTIPNEYRTGGFAMGCQAWSFNHFTAFEAIEKTAAAGGKVIEFYPDQKFSAEDGDLKLNQNLPDDKIQKLKDKLAKHHVMAVNYGVVGLGTNEAEDRKVFEFAKKMGMVAVTSEPDPNAMDLLERLVKEYDIKLAIHDHPKRANDPNYKFWDPNYVLSLVKNRDPRMGSCADTGHWVRSGVKPIDALRILQGRIISSHLKDLNVFSPDGHDMPYGEGISDVPAILNELKRQNFQGNISVEYEYNMENSLPEISQCIGFVRGYTAFNPGPYQRVGANVGF